MYRHVRELQFTAKPEKPDALFAMKFREILGGQIGEMTVMMQYLWQGWSCRVPGGYEDMINRRRRQPPHRPPLQRRGRGAEPTGLLPPPDPKQFVTVESGPTGWPQL